MTLMSVVHKPSRVRSGLAVLLLFLLCMTSPSVAESLDVFLFAGQSNQTGSGKISEVGSIDFNALSNVIYSYDVYGGHGINEKRVSESLIPLQPRLSIGANTNERSNFGPDFGFARRMDDYVYKGDPFAVIKVAKNGAGLGRFWGPSGSANDLMRQRMFEFVDQELLQLILAGFEPEIKMFAWVQGTADAKYETYADNYQQNLANLVSGLRERYGPAIQVGVARLHADSNKTYAAIVREQQMATAFVDPLCFYVNLERLVENGLKSDQVHYNSLLTLRAGQRMATRYWWHNRVRNPKTYDDVLE